MKSLQLSQLHKVTIAERTKDEVKKFKGITCTAKEVTASKNAFRKHANSIIHIIILHHLSA